MLVTLLGGFGLFLLGMGLLTDGLKAAAGEALRGWLVRFTGGPVRAMVTGAGVTAAVQSSSATVVTTIGFVSAGLITFPAAVGIIFGANIGTTSTGWIVAAVGLKLSMGAIALPLVMVGALLRVLGRGRTTAVGLAIAGFGLIFFGINLLQDGMAVLSSRVDPAAFPSSSLAGRLLLVGVGIAMTVVMQSSSAAVAATLTALHAGAIGLEQAAALVVGQNIGTTVTAALACIGASAAARRTALAHILFNGVTGVIAFGLVPLLLRLETRLWLGDGTPDPAMLLAGFHTAFNAIGILVLGPFLPQFASAITRMLPDSGPALTRHLDPSVARVPAVAVEAARRTVMDVGGLLVQRLIMVVEPVGRRPDLASELDRADDALGETRRFLARAVGAESASDQEHHLAVLHAIDHLDRLIDRLRAAPVPAASGQDFRESASLVVAEGAATLDWLLGAAEGDVAGRWQFLSGTLAERRRRQREEQLRLAAAGQLDADEVLRHLDAGRWLDSSAYHVGRALHHLSTRTADGEVERRD
jgi:phosphate:Na+ symporter